PAGAQATQTASAASDQSGNTSIAGVVVNAATGAPVDGVDVRLFTPGEQGAQAGESLTDANGAFRFSGLPQGKYRLQASRRGYITSGYQDHNGFSTAIVTGPQQDTSHLRFALTPFGVIDGTISDDSGDPVSDAQVRLFRQDEAQGEGRILSAGQQMSDDRGTFEFPQLRPGSYFICVTAAPWYAFRPAPQMDSSGNPLPDDQQPASALDVAYPVTFYPNATDSSGATPIPVRGGDRLQINFSLHAVPAVHIRLQLPVQANGGNAGIVTPQLTEDAFGIPLNLQIYPQPAFRRGQMTTSFEYGGVAPGHYEFRQGGSTVPLDARSNVSTTAPPPAADVEVTGKVGMASGGALPAHVMIFARRVNGESFVRTAGIQSDGSFTLHGVTPGTYEVSVRGGSAALVVSQMAASGGEVQGDRVTVGSDPVLLAATLARGSATINGFVQRSGQGVGGVMVELVPDDPSATPDLIRRDQSDSDGSFTLRRVVAGNYRLVAIDNGWTLEWAKHDALSAYLSQGVRVRVGEDEKLQLPSPVPVQER
ncbi:MAG TPA: carboxypeptidase-like regulatory domain-containing protein, partial [Acidobacteriaceae bacterium]|nr:carboxypeptidase-like regulatory domain-containing protein [Acidobacteriaceae bacterium]